MVNLYDQSYAQHPKDFRQEKTADSSDLGENLIYFMGVEYDINYLVDINTMVNIYWSYLYELYF